MDVNENLRPRRPARIVLTIARAAHTLRPVPTETPPPYFPQSMLSPGDQKTARKMRLAFYGCMVLLLLALAGVAAGVVYLFRWLS